MTKVTKNEHGTFWSDPDGDLVKIGYISPAIQKDERLVSGVFKLVERQKKAMLKIKQQIGKKIGKEERKTIYNFDKSQKIVISKKSRIAFNENLEAAHEKIKEFISSEGSSDKVALIISKAFKRTRKGDADPVQLNKLKDLQFKSQIWIDAMTLLDKSQITVPVKKYVQFYHRDPESGSWIQDSLNFSNL